MHHLDSPQANQTSISLADLSSQTEQTIAAFRQSQSMSVLTQSLAQLDQVYLALTAQQTAQQEVIAFVNQTAQLLLRDNQIFENLNFHASLLANGSVFFGAVIRKMGEMAAQDPNQYPDLALPVRIRLVEHFRRGNHGELMATQAESIERELQSRVEKGEPLALGQLAKIRYEQSMYAYAQNDFERAIELGNESASLCTRADDLHGELAARGNTAGLFLYEWARVQLTTTDQSLSPTTSERSSTTEALIAGRDSLLQDLRTAQSMIRDTNQDPAMQNKFKRVEGNIAAHLLQIADLTNDRNLAEHAFAVLMTNPMYLAAIDPLFPNDPQRAQPWVQDIWKILNRLREQA